jgi:iron complex transport system substrate-binding protein
MMSETGAQRIVSFLPSATEMVYALGLGDRLLGVTHECDFPDEATRKPVVVRSVLPVEDMSQRDIDTAVSLRLRDGQSLYKVDEALMRQLAPDLILTQDLCQVCAPSGNEVTQLLASLAHPPHILWLTPRSLGQIFGNLRDIAQEAGRAGEADRLIARAQGRLNAIAEKTRSIARRPRVFCMEWLDPIYCCGHWVPEMVRIAGGEDALGRAGADSVRITWDDVRNYAPDVVVVMPCGFHLESVLGQADQLADFPGWFDLPAVRSGRVFAVDASSYFARPGPRVVDGTELLAHLIHPQHFGWEGPDDAFRRLTFEPGRARKASARAL